MSSSSHWSDSIRTNYLSGAANQFLLHGNVNDRLLLPADPDDMTGKSAAAQVGNLKDFLVDHQLQKFDIVLSYELGAGLRVESGTELFKNLNPRELPKNDPVQGIGYLDYFLRYCANLRNITPSDRSDGEKASVAGKNYHIAFVILGSDLIFPMSRQTRDYQLSSMAAVVCSWSRETHFLEQNLAVFLVTENLADLHPLLAGNQRAAQLEIEMPGASDLAEAFGFFAKEYPKALSNFSENPKLPAVRLAGASLGSVEGLLKMREFQNDPLVENDLADLKKQLVEQDANGLIEFIEPTRTLDDVYGHDAIKKWVRQDIALWQQGDLEAMPMGYLLCGPVGTGKTYIVECLAGEAGVPVVKIKNFLDAPLGSSEGNLERIFKLLHALGRCIVFVDEADQALGKRDNSGSSTAGVQGRIYSMFAKEMSARENRGRILWILASSRPDLIEVDLKRPGRVDVKIPLFPAHEKTEAYMLIRALCKKHDLKLPKETPTELIDLIPPLVTPGAAESIAIKVYRLVKTRKVDALEALRDCLDEYQNPIPKDIMDFQISIAVREASDLDFVPEEFRRYGKL